MYIYSPSRHDFSRKMSRIAFRRIYVPVLDAVSIDRMDVSPDGPTDPDLRGTDVVLILKTGRRVTVAERFRKVVYAHFDDITIRYASLSTGRKLEILGLNAQYMLYAVANETEDGFVRWDLIYAPKLMELTEKGGYAVFHNHDGSSTFLVIPRKLLFEHSAVAASSESS